MKQVTVGILAHVDAGKTTSIESMLYIAGKLKKTGRVDHQDAFLELVKWLEEQEKNHSSDSE